MMAYPETSTKRLAEVGCLRMIAPPPTSIGKRWERGNERLGYGCPIGAGDGTNLHSKFSTWFYATSLNGQKFTP
jgi:hypothetical protein